MGQWVKFKWDISTDFRSATAAMNDGTFMHIDGESLTMPAFRESGTGELRAAHWLLGLLISHDWTTLATKLKPAALNIALNEGQFVGCPPLLIKNEGRYTIEHDGQSHDFDRLWFDVEVTVKPHKGQVH